MARRKSPVAEAAAAQPADVFDEAIAAQAASFVDIPVQPAEQAAAIVQQVADSTRLPADTVPPVHPTGRHADTVGRRDPRSGFADPFDISTDVLAGVRLMESRRFGKMLLSFEEKPSAQVIEKLRDAKYRYEPGDKVWTKELRDNPMGVRIVAERLFQDVSKQIRLERGIAHSIGMTA